MLLSVYLAIRTYAGIALYERSERVGRRIKEGRVKLSSKLMVQPGTTVKLSDYKPDETFGYSKGPKADEALAGNLAMLDELQAPFAAEKKRALLIVLQGMDTCGKDGTIRHVMSGLNPQGSEVAP